MKKLFVFLIFAFPIFVFSQQSELPSISLKDLNGKEVNISELGKGENPVIISFWATWCGPCLKELAAINDVYDEWQEETGVELIAISIDDAKSVKRVKPLVNGKGWDYQVLLDDNHNLKRAMNVANVPYTLVVYKGKIVYKHTSYTPGVEKELFKQVKAALKK
ncbi:MULTISPECIES: TlpA family protein disulfide reductase [Myroides]|uniref:Redoxin domain-containing protein n=1 Tax=Myroides albus TaxID=2562892 RepID=A0A6I3LQ35_9FLAO|nr:MULTISPECIES: TlpA disulfide reductase family protein [Myroides]MTG99450.1 redoxin domain-containing protein [Myroides albus]MVX37069.1 redoxin domain-containing protein [Myroides sp. LoEW2-1]UVD81141.1 TlpA family protein disulfide reductase [Myroides albus]